MKFLLGGKSAVILSCKWIELFLGQNNKDFIPVIKPSKTNEW